MSAGLPPWGFPSVPALIANRPRYRAPEILEAATYVLAQELAEFLEGTGQVTSGRMEDMAREVIDLREFNGYKAAKILESKYSIEPDTDLVQLLEGVETLVYHEHKRAVQKWVVDNHIDVPFRSGLTSKVSAIIRGARGVGSEHAITGCISGIDRSTAQVFIRVETSQYDSDLATTKIVNVEDVTPLNPKHEENIVKEVKKKTGQAQ